MTALPQYKQKYDRQVDRYFDLYVSVKKIFIDIS